ncbi:MAG: TldD/PmbA family protein, partial [Myxococcales bacterium]|nr:TldD/PmbA family protein [Myxococcales bacterium]
MSRYSAPFAPGGPAAVDAQIARRLLSIALSRGGDYADLFYEYDVSGSFSYEEGILKAAGRSVSTGLGVRVRKGDATGYAYVEDLSVDAMERAARTAAQIADGGGAPEPVGLSPVDAASRYAFADLSLDLPGEHKRELLARADAAARAADPRVQRVEASFAEQIREILIATSDGLMVRDRQPLLRIGVRVIVEADGKRQAGSSGGGGRVGWDYFDGKSPEDHAKEAVRQAVVMLDAREAPAGEMEVVLAPGDSGILLHEAVGHG